MAKRLSKYATMTASDLARVTREKGLTKPEGLLHISEWADFLEAHDKGEAVADSAIPFAAGLNIEEHNSAYARMSSKQLKAEAKKRGVDTSDLATDLEIIDALEAADGTSEDDQAAADGVEG